MATDVSTLRTKFFEYLFGESRGYLCIAYCPPTTKQFKQTFFEWPKQKLSVESFINGVYASNNMWFCTSLLNSRVRHKTEALKGSIVWADLDTVDPETIDPAPSCVVITSPGRYHAFWRLDRTIVPEAQEDYSRKIAYKVGADTSGWDLTQLLRIPYTYNLKREYDPTPTVTMSRAIDERIPVGVFDQMEGQAKDSTSSTPEIPLPDMLSLPKPEEVAYKYQKGIRRVDGFEHLYLEEPSPTADWSRLIWRLINICLEIGMTDEETFVIASTAKCNKYGRDDRPISHLWRDVLKASGRQKKQEEQNELTALIRYTVPVMPRLVAEEESTNEFVNRYKAWAAEVTDAPPAYHELACAILLSSMFSPALQLETIFGTVSPNLWGLILGESTVTRKSTAMAMTISMASDLDPSLVLATEASPEGLLSGLEHRPNQASIFFKDEVSGLFESFSKKEYLAGMPEILTQLYDTPRKYTRLLRKGPITIEKPYFIFFGGGIKDRVQASINQDYILSGFIPRFLVVSGEREQRTSIGPPGATSHEKRSTIMDWLKAIDQLYNREVEVRILGNKAYQPLKIDAELTPEAWAKAKEIEDILEESAEGSSISALLVPTFGRLLVSMLKLSMLLCCTRKAPTEDNKMVIELEDVTNASVFIQRWGEHTVNLVTYAGKGPAENVRQRVLRMVTKKPGISRSDIMRPMHLSSREMNDIARTLIDRGEIDEQRSGKATVYYPTEN